MNKDKRNNIQLLGTLNNADESGIIANANQVYDANEDKSIQDVSKEHKERIETLETKESSMQTTLENITKTGEASAASNVTYNHSDSKLDATNVQQAVDEVRKRSNYNDGDNIIDFNTIHLITDNPEFVCVAVDVNDKILYGIKTDGQPYFGVGCPQRIKDAINAAVGNVLFDISAYHATGGTLATYDNLEDALGTNGKNIPQSLRKGGMSVKFVQTSDNKYVQWRLMSDSFNTTVINWQGVDDEPTAGSDNLVKSGGVSNSEKALRKDIGDINVVIDAEYTQSSSNYHSALIENGHSYKVRLKITESYNVNLRLCTATSTSLANIVDFVTNQRFNKDKDYYFNFTATGNASYIVVIDNWGTVIKPYSVEIYEVLSFGTSLASKIENLDLDDITVSSNAATELKVGLTTNDGERDVELGAIVLSSATDNKAGVLPAKSQWDSAPVYGSDNLVKSGGVQNELALGAVYDVSAKNPTAGPNNDGKFESLSALLSDANLNTLIPTAVRKGGMSIKFIQKSDNKYVQYRLMSDSFNTTVANWQGVDKELKAGSNNFLCNKDIYNALGFSELVEKKALNFASWGNISWSVVETNIFGKTENVYKIDFNIVDTSKNTFGFTASLQNTHISEGDIVNMCVLIYTEDETERYFPNLGEYSSGYSGTFTALTPKSFYVKKGFNYFFYSMRSNFTQDVTDAPLYQLFFKDNSLNGKTWYIKAYYYIGSPSQKFLPTIDSTPTIGSKNLILSGAVALGLGEKQNNLPIKSNELYWKDVAVNLPYSSSYYRYTTDLTSSIADSDGIRFWTKENISGWWALGWKLRAPLTRGHSYAVFIDMELYSDGRASSEGSSAGNTSWGGVAARAIWDTNTIRSVANTPINNIMTVGNRGNLAYKLTIGEYDDAQELRMQVAKFTNETPNISLKIYAISVLDLTACGIDYSDNSEILTRLSNVGYNHSDIYNTIYDIKVRSAEEADNSGGSSKPTIEFWGDSLIAQGYGTNYVAPLIGRTCITRGYGGKKSTYIRDQFLANANLNNSIVINVGRNNFSSVDVVIQDIRKMVEALPHSRFLICTPPNGNYAGEGKGESGYEKFIAIRDRLALQYPANFLDTRSATIQEYNMGNVILEESFVQPAVNGNVTIHVSDATFLTTYNSSDVTRWGETLMKKIAIGQNIDLVDIYEVVSFDTQQNTITVKLLESNRGIGEGGTVANGVDDGGTSSIMYLRVLQYADYYCWLNDRTQSTFRSDGIHMSKSGQQCIAKVVARKILQMNI